MRPPNSANVFRCTGKIGVDREKKQLAICGCDAGAVISEFSSVCVCTVMKQATGSRNTLFTQS